MNTYNGREEKKNLTHSRFCVRERKGRERKGRGKKRKGKTKGKKEKGRERKGTKKRKIISRPNSMSKHYYLHVVQ